MTGSHQEDELQNINRAEAEIAGCFVLTHAHTRQCIDEISPWVLNVIRTFPEDHVKQLVVATAKLFVETPHGITQIAVEQDASNNAGSEIPPVLPEKLMRINLRAFTNMVAHQRRPLKIRMSESEIEEINVQFLSMKRAYREKPRFRDVVDACDDIKSDFAAGWMAGAAADRFGFVCEFYGSLKRRIFQNTATVESDFSIIGWEKDVYRTRLTDFSLEVILDCKQF